MMCAAMGSRPDAIHSDGIYQSRDLHRFNKGRQPDSLVEMTAHARAFGFDMASDNEACAFLRCLAASKPGGRFLEIGTGVGHATAWLLDGMDSASSLVSIDISEDLSRVAHDVLGNDPRLNLIVTDAADYLRNAEERSFDLIFADSWPGKFSDLDEALAALRPGGFYVVDDLSPQPNWPDGHAVKVQEFLTRMDAREDFVSVRVDWSTGLLIATKRPEA